MSGTNKSADVGLPEVMTVAQIRAAEARTMAHTPEAALMDRAAHGLAAACAGLLERRDIDVSGAQIVVLAGTGNNGGDALLAGARLAELGAVVTAIGVGATAHQRGLATARAAGVSWCHADSPPGLATALETVTAAAMVIDGIAGIGSSPGLRAPADRIVEAIPPRAIVVAVDVPSGFDADSGQVPKTHVEADLTVTFTARKPCLVEPEASHYAGEIVVVDVGVSLDR
ncbi:NAD(P)H-hydrate epimerase [Demequina sp.]|uniref:NAD(P)H-hydrate epimerase n=1 Tax=Demequina sp. TaxID=2050685 RepID=UPI0025C6714D|nr:NAD(P)H-hydrate epimerase [Demequina sp.]